MADVAPVSGSAHASPDATPQAVVIRSIIDLVEGRSIRIESSSRRSRNDADAEMPGGAGDSSCTGFQAMR